MTTFIRFCGGLWGMALLGVFSGCTPEIKNVLHAEWDAATKYDYVENAKKVSGLSDTAWFDPNPSIADNIDAEYCAGASAEGRRLMVNGLSEDAVAYGGCILEVPVPYEPQRLWGRP